MGPWSHFTKKGPQYKRQSKIKKREKQNKTLVQKFAVKLRKKALKFKAPGLCPAYSEE